MPGDRRGRESIEKERDGEAKPQGLALAGGAAKALLGGSLGLHKVRGGCGQEWWSWDGMLESRGGTWALSGAVSPRGVTGTTPGWMDGCSGSVFSLLWQGTPPPCSKGKGALKLGFSRL